MTDEVQNDGAVATDEHVDEALSAPNTDLPAALCQYAKLVLKRGGAETDIEFPVNSPAVAGRFDPSVGPIDIDLGTLPEGSYVSRKHAKFTCDDGVWHVHDLGSSNGTFVLNDDFERVETSPLHDGQEIALGNARFVFHLTDAT